MHRLLVGTCVLALAVVAVRAADEKKEEKKSVTAAFNSMFKELVGKYRAAKDQKEKDKLLTAYAEKFVDLAEKNPKDPATLNLLLQTATLPLPASKDGPKNKALAMLQKDYLKSDKIRGALRSLSQSDDPAVGKFIKAVLDENPDKATRGEALKAYLGSQEQIVMADKDAKQVEEARKEIDKYRKLLKKDFKDVKDLFIGAAMPEVVSKNLEDKEVKLSDLKGKVVVLDIWATWCPPCRAMIPHERELVKKLKEKPFVLVSVSADDKKETLEKFLKDNEMPWTHWFNGDSGGVVTALGVTYYPTIYVLDHKGVIRYKDVRGEAMDKAVEKLLKEMEDEKKAKT